jgi:hypothetical protein
MMFINKDPKASAEVKITISGGTFTLGGARFDYGESTLKDHAPVAKAPFKADGMTFKITVPAYSIADIVLPKAP